MKKRAKILAAAILCSTFLSGISGCGNKEAASGNGLKIFFALNQMDTFRGTLVDAAREAAEAQGAQFDVMDAGGVIEAQTAQIKQAAADNYDVILCSAVSAETAVELEATAGDIPIVFVNSCPEDERLKAGQYVFAGSEEFVAGQYQAEYILEQMSGESEINIVLLKGPSNHSATKGRTKGLKQTLADSGKQVHYVFEDHADWDTGQAEKLFDVFMRTGADVDCVVCNNDAMAIGVVQACKAAGLDMDKLLILGVDATADGCQAIQEGDMDFTVYQSATGQGQAAIKAALQLAAGSSVEEIEGAADDGKYVWVPFEKVDSSNVDQYAK